MTYRKGSVESVRETRHSLLMGQVLNVANQYGTHASPGESAVELMGFGKVMVTTYYHAINHDGLRVLATVQHEITVTTTTTEELLKP